LTRKGFAGNRLNLTILLHSSALAGEAEYQKNEEPSDDNHIFFIAT